MVDCVSGAFRRAKIIDRREQPSHGYRAVHIVVDVEQKLVEIQVPTELQQLWAGLSELLGSGMDQSIKYGGGPKEIRTRLALKSELIVSLESEEKRNGAFDDLVCREREVKDRLTPETLELEAKGKA